MGISKMGKEVPQLALPCNPQKLKSGFGRAYNSCPNITMLLNGVSMPFSSAQLLGITTIGIRGFPPVRTKR